MGDWRIPQLMLRLRNAHQRWNFWNLLLVNYSPIFFVKHLFVLTFYAPDSGRQKKSIPLLILLVIPRVIPLLIPESVPLLSGGLIVIANRSGRGVGTPFQRLRSGAPEPDASALRRTPREPAVVRSGRTCFCKEARAARKTCREKRRLFRIAVALARR